MSGKHDPSKALSFFLAVVTTVVLLIAFYKACNEYMFSPQEHIVEKPINKIPSGQECLWFMNRSTGPLCLTGTSKALASCDKFKTKGYQEACLAGVAAGWLEAQK